MKTVETGWVDVGPVRDGHGERSVLGCTGRRNKAQSFRIGTCVEPCHPPRSSPEPRLMCVQFAPRILQHAMTWGMFVCCSSCRRHSCPGLKDVFCTLVRLALAGRDLFCVTLTDANTQLESPGMLARSLFGSTVNLRLRRGKLAPDFVLLDRRRTTRAGFGSRVLLKLGYLWPGCGS